MHNIKFHSSVEVLESRSGGRINDLKVGDGDVQQEKQRVTIRLSRDVKTHGPPAPVPEGKENGSPH